MFEPGSRYFALETGIHVAPDGRRIAYVRRRFLPRQADLQWLGEVSPVEGDRLDLLAARTLGDPEQFWRICDANDAMNPFDLVTPGASLKIPLPETGG
ncbi:MAG TPA: hypothetical protein ENI90_09460 [Methylothermaceae bacterium]|nr:hypothetical protein [Methylothermaceae bacterium]